MALAWRKRSITPGVDVDQPEAGDRVRQKMLGDSVRVPNVGGARLGVDLEPPSEEIAEAAPAVFRGDRLEPAPLALRASLRVDG